ncbi:MAG: ChbG/HpnK family deacetylase [Bacteroidota bacterium]
MNRPLVVIACSFLIVASPVLAQSTGAPEPIDILVRCDDAGMSHAVNKGFERLAESGLLFSASLMVPCPWFPEAVEILGRYPHVSVGLHLTLNAEWKGMRWGPVLGPAAVPSLVDSLGYFFPSRALLMANGPKLDEVEGELRAQIQRALRAGVKPDYVDYHMGAAVGTPELRAIVEKLAAEFGLGISRYFGEQDADGVYRALPEHKTDSLLTVLERLKPGVRNLLVFHISDPAAEMDALIDLNVSGLPEMGRHRAGELNALLSPKLWTEVARRTLRLVTYRDLILVDGLSSMKSPVR